jgi:hypothetical protein
MCSEGAFLCLTYACLFMGFSLMHQHRMPKGPRERCRKVAINQLADCRKKNPDQDYIGGGRS